MVRNLVPKDLHNQALFPVLNLQGYIESLWLYAYRKADKDHCGMEISVSDKRNPFSFHVYLYLIPKQLINISN